MIRFGWLDGGVCALLQLTSGAPSLPGTFTLEFGLIARASGLSCSIRPPVVAPAFGTFSPWDGLGGYNCDCSIQFSQTTNGYWLLLTGQVAATQISHAVSSIEPLISFGAAHGFGCVLAEAPDSPATAVPDTASASATAAAAKPIAVRVIDVSFCRVRPYGRIHYRQKSVRPHRRPPARASLSPAPLSPCFQAP